MEKIYAIKNKKLLRVAQNIFGEDMVLDAWVLGTYPYDLKDQDWYINDLKKENKELNLKESSIDIGGITIALKLSNGRIITATSSEWGDISKNE